MNSNYKKGRAFEYRIKKKFEKQGYIVLRTSGSHGFADLIAVRKGEVIFIQCKDRKLHPSDIKDLPLDIQGVSNVRILLVGKREIKSI